MTKASVGARRVNSPTFPCEMVRGPGLTEGKTEAEVHA